MKPKSWDEYKALSRDDGRLWDLIRVRLIELVFSQDNATSIRAIELLQSTSSEHIEDDFNDLSIEDLRGLRERARKFIYENRGNGHEDD
jgi:hypothetical protein